MEEIVVAEIESRTLLLECQISEDSASGFDLETACYP
jgi:hypothetical protein